MKRTKERSVDELIKDGEKAIAYFEKMGIHITHIAIRSGKILTCNEAAAIEVLSKKIYE